MSDRIHSLSEAISLAEKHWNLTFKIKTEDEACAPCPWCGGEDRFLVFHTGYYLCREGSGHCGRKGWILDEVEGNIHQRLTAVEIKQMRQDAKIAAIEREQRKQAERIAALEAMARCQDPFIYHNNVDMARDYWHDEGINDESIERWMLGYCQRCPLDGMGRASHTIPVKNRGIWRNIRHRIIGAEGRDKYRPHMKGLGNTLFYADALFKPDTSMIMLWEGEKKAIVNAQHGFDGPAVMGMQGFLPEWAKWFWRFDVVYVCYDPDAIEKAVEVAQLMKGKGRVVELPMKADDIWGIGMTEGEMCEFLRKAKVV